MKNHRVPDDKQALFDYLSIDTQMTSKVALRLFWYKPFAKLDPDMNQRSY